VPPLAANSPPDVPRVSLSAGRIARALAVAIAALTAASLAGQISKYFLGHDHVFGLVALFDLDAEGNVPTWFSTVQLLACSVLLGLIGSVKHRRREPFARHWLVLSAIFLYMSADEASVIHELLNPVIRSALHVPPVFYYAWVVGGAVAVLVVGLVYLRFVWSLPARTRRLVIIAGSIYVAGALGMDVPEGLYAFRHGMETFPYALMTTVEEVMEMAGLTVFLYALLLYVGASVGGIQVEVKHDG